MTVNKNCYYIYKNPWRRKCVRIAIFWNVEVRVEGDIQLCHCAICQGSSYTKNEYRLFIRNLMRNIFLFDNFFEKSCIFRENRKKLFWGRIWQFFKERRSLMPKINITFFITNEVSNILLFTNFFQKSVIFWENARKPFLGPKSLLKERRHLSTRMNTFFFEKWGLKYFIV